MIRHTNSFIVSLLLHALIIGMLFHSYRVIAPSFRESKKEKILCINLSCMSHTKQVEKKATVEPTLIPKKTIQKLKPKPKPKKVEPPKKRVYVKEAPKVVFSEKKVVKIAAEETLKSPLHVEPTTSELVIKETKTVTAEEKYVDENLAKIVKLLQENLYYPRRARKRGVEGDLLVRFKLSPNAEVTDAEVLSSTSEVLSRGALKTINSLSLKFPKPKEKLILCVPIVYKLN